MKDVQPIMYFEFSVKHQYMPISFFLVSSCWGKDSRLLHSIQVYEIPDTKILLISATSVVLFGTTTFLVR